MAIVTTHSVFLLPLILEVLENVCIVIICLPVCDAINSEVITLDFLSSHFPKLQESQDKI